MRQFRNILVGVDLMNVESRQPRQARRPSRQALARAIWLASHAHAKLTIFSVVGMPPFMEGLLREQLTEAHKEITGITAEILEHLVAQAKSEGVERGLSCGVGVPWEEICRQVQRNDNDLVIVGTRDLGYTGRHLFRIDRDEAIAILPMSRLGRPARRVLGTSRDTRPKRSQ